MNLFCCRLLSSTDSGLVRLRLSPAELSGRLIWSSSDSWGLSASRSFFSCLEKTFFIRTERVRRKLLSGCGFTWPAAPIVSSDRLRSKNLPSRSSLCQLSWTEILYCKTLPVKTLNCQSYLAEASRPAPAFSPRTRGSQRERTPGSPTSSYQVWTRNVKTRNQKVVFTT